MAVFGDGTFEEVSLNEVIRMGLWSNKSGVLIRETPESTPLFLSLPPRPYSPALSSPALRRGHVRTEEKVDLYKQGSKFSPEAEFAGTLIMDF